MSVADIETILSELKAIATSQASPKEKIAQHQQWASKVLEDFPELARGAEPLTENQKQLFDAIYQHLWLDPAALLADLPVELARVLATIPAGIMGPSQSKAMEQAMEQVLENAKNRHHHLKKLENTLAEIKENNRRKEKFLALLKLAL